jgi:hypothetical protein
MTPQLNAAIAKAKREFPKILANKSVKIPTKSGREIKFTYAELEEIIPAVTPVLSANGLAIAHQLQFVGDRYCLVSSLRHESGEQIDSVFPLPATFDDPKDLGNKITYGRRYSTLCLLDIVASDDGDGDERRRKFVKDIKEEAGLITAPTPIKKGDSSFIDSFSPNSGMSVEISVVPINREMVCAEIDSLMRRKNVSTATAKEMAKGWFGVTSRQSLSDNQLVEFRDRLSLTAPVNTLPVA